MDFSRFRGTTRLLLIFASSNSEDSAERQRDHLEGHEAGFADRDLLMLRILEDVPRGTAGESITPSRPRWPGAISGSKTGGLRRC